MEEAPAVEYPAEEDPVRLALQTQENDESVQPCDFLDKAFLVKRLYSELGTLEAVAEKLGWKGKAGVYHYINIANLPESVFTEIRNSVNRYFEESVNDEVYGRKPQNLDDLWKPTWFRHICSLPSDELKLAVVKKIAQNPASWKEKDVAQVRNFWMPCTPTPAKACELTALCIHDNMWLTWYLPDERSIPMQKKLNAMEDAYYRRGKPMAAFVPISEYEKWERDREEFFSLIEKAWGANRGINPESVMRDVAEAVKEAREGRTVQGGA